MAYITVQDANAWTDKSKLTLTELDSELEASVARQVFARISQAYDTSTWVDSNTTPSLIRKIIAMQYVAWYYERAYSEDGGQNTYSDRLFQQAEALIEGLITGAIDLPDNEEDSTLPKIGTAEYEFGEPKFTMGQIW